MPHAREEKDHEILPVSALGKPLPGDVKCLCGDYASAHNDAHGNENKGPCTECFCEWFEAAEKGVMKSYKERV